MKTTHLLISASAVVLLLAAPCFAAQTAPAASPAASAPVTQTSAPAVPDATVDPKTLAAATELVKMLDSSTMMKGLLNGISHNATMLVARANPGQDAKAQKLAMDSVTKVFTAHMAELDHNRAIVYAQEFTYDEIEQIIAFYKTPVGDKMLKTTPLLMQKSMLMDQSIFLQIMKETKADMDEQLKKNGLNVPKEMGAGAQ